MPGGGYRLASCFIRSTPEKGLQPLLEDAGNPHDAEDSLQEIYLKVFDRVKNYRGDSAFSTWLYRMTANHCLDILRRRKILSFMGFETVPEVEDKKRSGAEMGLGLQPGHRGRPSKAP